jgi:hypothetical protein
VEIHKSLIPGTREFNKLLRDLGLKTKLGPLLSVANRIELVAQDLLQYSVFTEHWRFFEDILAGHQQSLEGIPAARNQIETMAEITKNSAFALDPKTIKRIRIGLMKTNHARDRNALAPRSCPVILSSTNGVLKKSISPRTGTIWLNKARQTQAPTEPESRFLFSLIMSIGLLSAHPFMNGNGRISRILLNTLPATQGLKPFPWSIFFLLRCGSGLYNRILFQKEKELNFALISFAENTIEDALVVLKKIEESTSEKPRTGSSSSNPSRNQGLPNFWHQLIHS